MSSESTTCALPCARERALVRARVALLYVSVRMCVREHARVRVRACACVYALPCVCAPMCCASTRACVHVQTRPCKETRCAALRCAAVPKTPLPYNKPTTTEVRSAKCACTCGRGGLRVVLAGPSPAATRALALLSLECRRSVGVSVGSSRVLTGYSRGTHGVLTGYCRRSVGVSVGSSAGGALRLLRAQRVLPRCRACSCAAGTACATASRRT